jgi:uncharacterized tellurite resistance protein B-like protein
MRWNQLSNDIPKAKALSDLLCGAATAYGSFAEEERVVVRAMLLKVLGANALPDEVEAHLQRFDPAAFNLRMSLDILAPANERDRKGILKVAADIVKADQVIESAERDYIIRLADALGLDFVDAF